MIYTITLNPSIDYFIEVANGWMENGVNRARKENMKAGGKGLNVSMVLEELHIPSVAIALLGGFSGDYICNYLKDRRYITLQKIPVEGANRINVKICDQNKTIAINGNGPIANTQTKECLREALNQVKAHDWVMINGSYAKQVDDTWIVELAEVITQKGARLIIDSERMNLEVLRQTKPCLIKPNCEEFSQLIGEAFSMDRIFDQAQTILDKGVSHILLSLGKDGALWLSQDVCYRLTHDALEAVNPVGTGDAMLAAVVASLSSGDSIMEAMCQGGAAGMAVASSIEDIRADQIMCFLDRCRVERIR